jgi:hypothetical protein
VKSTSIARWAGLAAGLTLALVALAGARVPAGTREVPAHLSLVAEPSVKLGVNPLGRELLTKRLLVPGKRAASGFVEVSNFTGQALGLRPRLRSLRGELPGGLRVELKAGGSVYEGELSELDARLSLPARAKRRVRIRISAPSGAAGEVQGRVLQLSLRWSTRVAGPAARRSSSRRSAR